MAAYFVYICQEVVDRSELETYLVEDRTNSGRIRRKERGGIHTFRTTGRRHRRRSGRDRIPIHGSGEGLV